MTFWKAFAETLRTIFADSSAVATMVLAVILYSFFYPSAYQAQVVKSLPVAVVDLDHSALSRSLIRRVAATEGARLVAMPESVAAARALLSTAEIDAILVIPSGLSRNVARGQSSEVLLFGSGLNLNRAKTSLVALGEALKATGIDAAITRARFTGAPTPPSIILIPHPLYNTREGYGSAVVPAVAPVIIHQTLLFGIAILLGTRRQRLGKLQFSPTGFAGAVCALVMLGTINSLYYEGWMFWFQDFPVAGRIGTTLLVTPLYILATVTFALCIGSQINNRERGIQLLAVTTLPMFFLSGFTWPSAPLPLYALAQILPTTPGIAAMVGANQMGATLAELSRPLWHLALLSAIYGALAFWTLCVGVSPASSDADNG